ncbi:hypothetical protein Tco_0081849, partial [Tanacetum coccineum]
MVRVDFMVYELIVSLCFFPTMDVLLFLIESDSEGVVEVFELVSPPVSLVIGAPPPSYMHEGDVLQGIHEMEDAKNKVPLIEHLTMKRNRSTDEVGGSGSVVADEELDPSYTLLVPLNVTPPMTM